jgi:hypothetical protein
MSERSRWTLAHEYMWKYRDHGWVYFHEGLAYWARTIRLR